MKYKVQVPGIELQNYGKPTENTNVGSMRLPVRIFVTVAVVIVLLAAIVLFGAPLVAKTGNLCLTEECINTASRVLKALDRSVEPCDDFYQYACGNWIRNNPIPDWTASWDRLGILREKIMQEMRQLLETDDKEYERQNISIPSGVNKAKALYRTCMDTGALEKRGLEPIVGLLQQVGLPEFPSNDHANTQLDWLFTIARTRRLLGVSLLIGISVTEDVRNSSANKIVIEQVSPGFGERYLLQAEKFSAEIRNYKKYITQMLKAYGKSTDVENFADDVVNFSTQIAQVMTPAEARRSPNHLFHEVNLLELANGPSIDSTTWRYINWTRYLDSVFNETSVVLNGTSDSAIILDMPYLQKLAVLLNNTNPISVERFLWWSVFSTVAPLTLANFRSLGFEFSQQLLGLQAKMPRWKGCTSNVNANFGLALSFLYVRTRFHEEYRDKALQMMKNIREAFERTVDNLNWMDAVTREKTLIKLHAIRTFVGYPGWILNSTQLDLHYKNAHVIDGDLFSSYLNLTNASIRRNLENVRRKADRNRWVASATTVNAFYSATLNSVTFPAGILKPPFYGNGIEALDYGSIGAIMGHELTHGFDDQGRRYDELGNLKQWWSTSTLDHYHKRVQCIIDQYNNYSIPNLGNAFRIHGFNTQGENIADNGGLRAAFAGYKITEDFYSKIQSKRLPGLENLSSDQLFYLGFAQIWCGNSTLGALKSKLIDGVHSPNRIRVIGTLSNIKEFSQAWNCPAGSPMNPANKCVLW